MIVRAASIIEQIEDCPDFLRSRVLRWANDADATGFELLAIGWPDKKHCFAVTPPQNVAATAVLNPDGILAAYRHAMRDPHAKTLFAALSCHLSEGGKHV
jgi:hypothetical protein